jgi:hypothetical protein
VLGLRNIENSPSEMSLNHHLRCCNINDFRRRLPT